MISTHNSERARRFVTLLLPIALLLALAFSMAGPATQADAACTGTSSWSSWTSWGKESSAWSSTCDSDNNYYGKVYDTKTDGSCVWIQSFVNGAWQVSPNSCNSSGTQYNYWDSNSITFFKITKSGSVGSQGTNTGF